MDRDRPFKRPEKNTYTQNTESAQEMARLEAQVNWVHDGMQGVIFPPDGKTLPTKCHDVVDLACGTGTFARRIASMSTREHPVTVQAMDISSLMISHARGMSVNISNVHFEVGNILSPLKYSNISFDLVNANLLFSVLKRDAWKPFLEECFRIARPGGLLRLTEANNLGVSPASPALTRLQNWGMQYIHLQQGYGFPSEDPEDYTSLNMTVHLPRLLTEIGWSDIQLHPYTYNYSAGTKLLNIMSTNAQALYAGWRKAGHFGFLSDQEWNELYLQAMKEMREKDFIGEWQLFVICAKKPL